MKRIIGIDLGTTNSAAAFMDDNGDTRIIPNDRGNRITPSIVAFTADGDILVGEAAKNQAVINADKTVTEVKRYMGSDKIFTLGERKETPEYISSLILAKLKKDAEEYLGDEIRHAVITVPAHFSEKERRATINAGRMAGFEMCRIINEPTAAALAYAYELENNRKVLVYDLGGGTFDVTFLEKKEKKFIVKSTCGSNRLGGIDFDRKILKKIVKDFSDKIPVVLEKDPVIYQQLRELVEKAKVELSSSSKAVVALPFIHGQQGPVHLSSTLERSHFEEMIGPYIHQSIELSVQAVKDAGYTIDDVDSLILAGGSSRIPLVRNTLFEKFKKEPVRKINPEEVVALGAAVQASILTGEERDMIFQDVVSHPLGLEIEGGQVVHLVRKNTPIPLTDSRVFTTVSDNQRSVEIHVVQGENSSAAENRSLGRFLLSDIRKGRKGEPRIEVVFSVNEDGILTVQARDIDTGSKQKVTLKTENGNAAGTDYSDESRTGQKKASKPSAPEERVAALISDIELLVARLGGKIDPQFSGEIDELLKEARIIMHAPGNKLLADIQLSLETILGELRAIDSIEREMTV